jgi:hypothetical protein
VIIIPEETSKPLQATFDVDDYDAEVVEGTGFEPGVRYQFSLEKGATGKYMQFGAAKGGLLVLKKNCPEDLAKSYQKHPDQFEIFSHGVINGQQALVPGRDFEKFKPYLSKIADVAWVHNTDSGKRLIFMTLNLGDRMAVNPGHPEWESPAVRLARKLGYEPPAPKNKDGTPNKEKFSLSFLHPGLTITAEVLTQKRKGSDKETNVLDIDTIELVSQDGAPASKDQKKITGEDIDPEIKANVLDWADGAKSVVEVIRKAKAHLKETKASPDMLGKYSEAITRMKESKEILA